MTRNIYLTPEQLRQFISEMPLTHGGLLEPNKTLFGYPVHYCDDRIILFIRCDYCGQMNCRCGAPKYSQAKPLEAGEGVKIFSAILNHLARRDDD